MELEEDARRQVKWEGAERVGGSKREVQAWMIKHDSVADAASPMKSLKALDCPLPSMKRPIRRLLLVRVARIRPVNVSWLRMNHIVYRNVGRGTFPL